MKDNQTKSHGGRSLLSKRNRQKRRSGKGSAPASWPPVPPKLFTQIMTRGLCSASDRKRIRMEIVAPFAQRGQVYGIFFGKRRGTIHLGFCCVTSPAAPVRPG
jgi:hypothetical protein